MVTTSALQVMDAFSAVRGLALDFRQRMSYTAHDRYVQTLFSHVYKDPHQGTTGVRSVNWLQLTRPPGRKLSS